MSCENAYWHVAGSEESAVDGLKLMGNLFEVTNQRRRGRTWSHLV